MAQICVIGHVTKDTIITREGNERRMPGGTAYYLSIALKSLGTSVCVITKVAEEDAFLLDELKKMQIELYVSRSRKTSTFKNVYRDDIDNREQELDSVGDAFTVEDVKVADSTLCYLGALTRNDFSLDVLQYLSIRSVLAVDVQGFLRQVENNRVNLADWEDKDVALHNVKILKANEAEARILSGRQNLQDAARRLSSYGPREVIITAGAKGSLVYYRRKYHEVPAFRPRVFVDSTGCGDTFMAGYLHCRLQSKEVGDIAKFAAAVASLKLEEFGPFKKDKREVRTFLSSFVNSS